MCVYRLGRGSLPPFPASNTNHPEAARQARHRAVVARVILSWRRSVQRAPFVMFADPQTSSSERASIHPASHGVSWNGAMALSPFTMLAVRPDVRGLLYLF